MNVSSRGYSQEYRPAVRETPVSEDGSSRSVRGTTRRDWGLGRERKVSVVGVTHLCKSGVCVADRLGRE